MKLGSRCRASRWTLLQVSIMAANSGASASNVARWATVRAWGLEPDLIIQDEAHHLVAGNVWGRIIDAWPGTHLIGKTATPERHDGKGLGVEAGGYFEALVLGPSAAWLVEQGWLARPKVFSWPGARNSKLRWGMGEYDLEQAARAFGDRAAIGDAVSHYRRRLQPGTTICFCCTIEHAEQRAGACPPMGANGTWPAGAGGRASRFRSRTARTASAAAPALRRAALTAATCFWPTSAMSSAAGCSNWRASWLKSRAQPATGPHPTSSRGPGARTRQLAAAPLSSCWSASTSAATRAAGPDTCGLQGSAARHEVFARVAALQIRPRYSPFSEYLPMDVLVARDGARSKGQPGRSGKHVLNRITPLAGEGFHGGSGGELLQGLGDR